MKHAFRLLVIAAFLAVFFGPRVADADDPLASWRTGVRIHPVAADTTGRHTIHAYFNTCPESPDGKYVLYYTSTTPEGEAGDLRILERSSGKETTIASDITTEDAHRAACQQWAAGGTKVVYHDCRDGRWRVVAVDIATLEQSVLVEDRQVGFGSPQQPWIPVYGCHWNPGAHKDLELIHVETGEIRRAVTVEQVVQEYGNWVQERFGTKDISIFFPVLSPNGEKVFFKLSRPSGGDNFRSKQASFRDGKVVYDLADRRFIRLFQRWGHPSWDPASEAIFEKGNFLSNVKTGRSRRYSPSAPTNHPTLSPNGTVFVTDADVSRRDFGKPGDWAIVVGDTRADQFVVVAQFNNTGGAKSWRRSHPHPAFSADGHRIYYNVNGGDRTRLFVAESAGTALPAVDGMTVLRDRKSPSDGPWRSLPLITDGKIDAAWAQVGWGGFVVDDESLRTECDDRGMGLLFYQPEKFGDCQIRVVYRCEKPKSNAGVFVRMDDGIKAKVGETSPEVHRDAKGKLSPEMINRLKEASEKHLGGWYPVHHGYEVQICDASDRWHRTGAIYSLAKAVPVPQKSQSEWRTMIISLDGQRITVDIDGQRLSSFDASAADNPPRKNWFEPIRELKRPTQGYIGLQNHDPGDVVWFKEVSVRPLESAK